MILEIERKFLVRDNSWRELANEQGELIEQFYFLSSPNASARVRKSSFNQDGCELTIKISGQDISERREFNYQVPIEDWNHLILMNVGRVIRKVRYTIPIDNNLKWEIDTFSNFDLVLAEIELSDINQEFVKPNWMGEEVTHDVKYLNSYMALGEQVDL